MAFSGWGMVVALAPSPPVHLVVSPFCGGAVVGWLMVSSLTGVLVSGAPSGKSPLMSPRSVQASLLRYNLFTFGVIYTTCLVVLPVDCAVRRRMDAPWMLMALPLAACIFRCTGSSWSVEMSNWCRRFELPRQLWHPVSAMAVASVVRIPPGRSEPSVV